MSTSLVALFGGAEKGNLERAYYCKNVEQLFEYFGEPPPETKGLYFAIQALMYGHELFYFRVQDEGWSIQEYLCGLKTLQDPSFQYPHVDALFLPGVGNQEIINFGFSVCRFHRGLLLINEDDFYDYLTDLPPPTGLENSRSTEF